jgi:hypothetical protein
MVCDLLQILIIGVGSIIIVSWLFYRKEIIDWLRGL